MTDAELQVIEARANAATLGPWVAFPTEVYMPNSLMLASHVLVGHNVKKGIVSKGVIQSTCIFIAHARDDVPALIAEVRAAQDELAAAMKQKEGRE